MAKHIISALSALALLAAQFSASAQITEYAGVKIHDSGIAVGKYIPSPGSRLINDTELTYSDGWKSERLVNRKLGRFCNTRSISKKEGARADYILSNSKGFIWHGTSAEGASAELFIDGVSAGVVDCSKPCPDGVVYRSAKLSPGEHRIAIVAGSKDVEIDFIECISSGSEPYSIDAGNGAFVYHTAGFKLSTPEQKSSTSILAATDKGEKFEVYFVGTSIRCYGEKSSDAGVLDIYVGGKKIKTVSLVYGGKKSNSLLFEIDNLPADRFNSIKAVVTSNGKRVAINSFKIEEPTCLMVEMNRRTDIELAQMATHQRTASDPKDWNPVSYAAKAPVNGVQLLKGNFRTVFERNISYLKDCLAKPNWVDQKDDDRIWIDMLYASNEGRMLGGMGHTLRWEQVPEFDEAIENILEAVDRRQFANGNGYLMPYGHETYNISKDTWPGIMRDEQKNYDRAMFTKGMLAAGMAGHERGYSLLRPFYDWFNSAEQYLPNMLLGSMGIQGSIAGPMVYHSPIGVPADIQTNMKYYDMDWWLDALSRRIPEAAWRFTLNRPHNYLLTSLCALFDIYLATGDETYLNAALGGWDIYHDYFQIPDGGISLCEHFECRPWTYNLKNLPNNIYETCGSIFWTDLNERFLQLWPENEKYAAEIEKAMYNVVIPAQGEDGKIRYFNQFNDCKYPPLCYNTCCEIQATAYYGMLPQYIYSQAEDGVYVNQFIASDYSFNVGGKKAHLVMQTGFPKDNAVSLAVMTEQPVSMKLRIRIPGWVDAKQIEVRLGKEVIAKGTPGTYLTIEREFKGGDVLKFSLPMKLRYEQYMGATRIEGAKRYAILCGPMLMAVTGPMMDDVFQAENEKSVKFDLGIDQFMSRLEKTADPCVFTVKGYPEYTLRPYVSFQEGNFTCFPGFKK